MSANLTKVPHERLLYINSKGVYYLRKWNEHENTDVSLKTTKLRVAIQLRDTYSVDRLQSQLGGKQAPKKKRFQIFAALDLYHSAKHPTMRRNIQKFPGVRHLRCETEAIPMLKKFFKKRFVDELTQDLLDEYAGWRPTQSAREADCLRSIDLELNTLSNALHWAKRKKKILENPIASHTRYYDPSKARKTKEVSAKTTVEFHKAGGLLCGEPRSESEAWLMMFEGMSGMRTDESLKLLFRPPVNDQLGHVDANHMWVRPAEKNNQGQQYLYLHDDLQKMLDAHAIWHKSRYPGNPWMFPGRSKEGEKPLGLGSLTAALDRLFEEGLIERKLTGHGSRGWYVLVRRSNGVSDSQIAVEVNQVGGLETLRTSYGVCPQSWLDGKGPKLPWIATALVAGCASNSNQVALETVGPRPLASMHKRSDDGTLIVYSALDVGADFYNRNPYGHRYTDYQVLNADGKIYEKVHNNNGTLTEDVVPVSLPPGNYRVKADSNGYGYLTVPVAIAAHQTTILHLEGGGTWQQREAFNDTNTMRLPGGGVVGYRSAPSN